MNRKFLLIIVVFSYFLSVILLSCAKEGRPQGGPQDTIPPVLLRSKPPMFSTNFDGSEIVLRFDEYFELKDINSNFFASPPFSQQPKFIYKGKSLVVRFKDTLRDSVTYTLDFGDAIVDYHEGNVLKDFTFKFSTYDKIDSMRVSGVVYNAEDLAPVPDVYVMLYKKFDDSIVFKEPPQYIARTNDSGKFVIFGVKEGQYKIFALLDQNNDFIYDGIENQVAFLENPIIPNREAIVTRDTLKAGTVLHDKRTGKIVDTLKQDSIIVQKKYRYKPEVNLYLFREYTRPQALVQASRDYSFKVFMRFNLPLIDDFLEVKCLQDDKNNSLLVEQFSNSDSVYIWLKNNELYSVDTLDFFVNFYTYDGDRKQMLTDTVSVYQPIDSNFEFKIDLSNDKIAYFERLAFETNIPLVELNHIDIDLVKILDTAAYNTKDLKPQCVRVSPDKINILFSKSILPELMYVTVEGYDLLDNSVLDTSNNILSVSLPENISVYDSVELSLGYRAKRFTTYSEPYSCNHELKLQKQEIKKTYWNKRSQIIVLFSKPIIDLQINSNVKFSYQIDRNRLIIELEQLVDTASFNISCSDYKDFSGKEVRFNKELSVKYNYGKPKIEKVARIGRDIVKIKFSKQLDSLISVNIVGSKAQTDFEYSVLEDSLLITIKNKDFKRQKFLNIIIEQKYLDSTQLWKLSVDTAKAELGRNPFKRKTTAMERVSYNLKSDRSKPRKYQLNAQLEPQSKYSLIFYPGAFTDIRNHTLDSLIILNFETNDNEYGDLTLKFNDDSIKRFLVYGNIILQLQDDKHNVVYKRTLTQYTSEIKLTRLIPDEYFLVLIFDKNKNGYWDTGNYLRHEQPEKIFVLPEKLTVKPNWEIEEEIRLK